MLAPLLLLRATTAAGYLKAYGGEHHPTRCGGALPIRAPSIRGSTRGHGRGFRGRGWCHAGGVVPPIRAPPIRGPTRGHGRGFRRHGWGRVIPAAPFRSALPRSAALPADTAADSGGTDGVIPAAPFRSALPRSVALSASTTTPSFSSRARSAGLRMVTVVRQRPESGNDKDPSESGKAS